MNFEHELGDLLDGYATGTLSTEETSALEERMKVDSDLRQKVEKHVLLVHGLSFYRTRNNLKNVLEKAHGEINASPKIVPLKTTAAGWKRYRLMASIAASVAIISVFGTLIVTKSLDEQEVNYKELRRNIEQIKKSQKMMLENIKEKEEKPLPGKYAGTGFLISSNGYVATSYHVVKEGDSVYIENEKFGPLKATIVYSDAENDLSLLKIENENGCLNYSLPFVLSKTEANLGEDVYTLGYPREDVVFGEGSVSALSGYKQNPNSYQISVPVNPGNSGGPLLNSKGDLIGIISGIQTETLGAAFAIKSTVLLEAITNAPLDTLSRTLSLPKQNSLKNSNRVQQVSKWKDFVFMVRVYKN